jgi:predicted Zn-dependent protease
VWLNNRACVELDAERDAVAALALADEATVLRPDVPAVQHTRARALLAVGRLDDAIAVLEGMRTGGELSLRLEAERCRELAAAWERKGQRDYADDYRDRARLHAVS